MGIRNLILCGMLVIPFLAGSVQATEFAGYAVDPEDGIIASDGTVASGILEVSFSADQAVTASVEGAGFTTKSEYISSAGLVHTFVLNAGDFDTVNKEYNLTVKIIGDDDNVSVSKPLTVVVDGTPPQTPTGLSALAADTSIVVAWDFISSNTMDPAYNVEYYRIYYADFDFSADLTTDAGAVTAIEKIEGLEYTEIQFTQGWVLDGLSNGKQYWIGVEAFDPADNRSGIAHDGSDFELISAEPITTISLAELAGFSDRCFLVTASLGDRHSFALKPYRWLRDAVLLNLPGGERLVAWYYRTSPQYSAWLLQNPSWRGLFKPLVWLGALLILISPLLLLLLAFQLFRFRLRKVLGSGLMLLCLFPASAQAEYTFHQQAWLEMGAMLPDINIETSRGTITYTDLYGSHPGLMTRLGWGWQITRDYGIPTLGATIGFWQRQGHPIKSSEGAIATNTTANLSFLPVSLELQYAFQYFDPQYVVPSLGVGFSFWGMEEALGEKERLQDFLLGWYWRAELRFLLDWMDESFALQLEDATGIKNTHLVLGWRDDRVDDFGQRSQYTLNYMMVDGSILFEF